MATDQLLDTLKTKPLSQLDAEEMRQAVELARSILRADYYRDVRGIADSVADAIKCGEVTDREGLFDRIAEECDSSGRVIYTALAQDAIRYSDNDSAYADNFGSEGIVVNGDIQWSRLAFAALERDVVEQLDAEGIDVNNPTFPGGEDGEQCG